MKTLVLILAKWAQIAFIHTVNIMIILIHFHVAITLPKKRKVTILPLLQIVNMRLKILTFGAQLGKMSSSPAHNMPKMQFWWYRQSKIIKDKQSLSCTTTCSLYKPQQCLSSFWWQVLTCSVIMCCKHTEWIHS